MTGDPSPPPPRPSLRDLLALGLLAAAARGLLLGGFSLWLDEVFLMGRGQGSPARVWAASLANADHPPLAALVLAAGNALGFSDLGHRLLVSALGVATVLLLAAWAGRGLGRTAGLLAGGCAALSPFFVRYSHELRPYPFLLFFGALALVLTARLAERPSAGRAAALAAALVGGLYSHYLFGLVVAAAAVPVIASAFSRSPEERARGRRALAFLGIAAAVALVLFVPWLAGTLGTLAGRPPAGGVKPWSWSEMGRRWQFLTVGGAEGDGLAWGGALAALLAALGLAAVGRRPAGWTAWAGIAFGLAGVELFLGAIGHFSRGRYDSVGGLFLPVLVGAGVAALAAPRWGKWGKPLAALALAALALAALGGLARYARVGRADWDQVARAVAAVRRPGEPVLVENEWTRLSLSYYLVGRDFHRRAAEPDSPRVVSPVPRGLARAWPADRAAVLVFSGYPRHRPLRLWARNFPLVGYFPRSDARVYLLTPEVRRQLAANGEGDAGLPTPQATGERPLPVLPEPASHPWLERLEDWSLVRLSGGS